jgi:flagellar biosynthesis/type III secretory pathway ATPase
MGSLTLFAQYQKRLKLFSPYRISGEVREVVGLVIEAVGLAVPVGALCRIAGPLGDVRCEAEVVGFRENVTLLQALCPERARGLWASGARHRRCGPCP